MNKFSWLSVVAVLAAVVAVVFLFPPRKHEQAPVEGAAPEAEAAARSLPHVQERLQQLSEARARGGRIGPNGKLDVTGQAPGAGPDKGGGARSMGRSNPHAAMQGEDAARDSNENLIDPQPEDIPTLKTMALHDGDPQRRLAAVILLGASEDPEVIPVLAQALADQDEDVRTAAVQSLADFTGEAPLDAIEGALNDPSADVRYEALEVLSNIGGERARRAVQRALSDPDEDVQELAQSILEFESDEDDSR